MSPESPNSSAETTDNIDVKLAFIYDEGITWANEDQFSEFEAEYQDSQDNSSLADPMHVEFQCHLEFKQVGTKRIIDKTPLGIINPSICWNEWR
jgi:hypothetical protein